MERLYNDDKIKAIGVSNFEIKDIQALLDNCDIVPMANQMPFYIGRDQKDLLSFCKKHDIVVEAYSPLATAQLAIRYCLDKDTLPLPKSTHEKRIIKSKELNFEMTADDLAVLDKLEDVPTNRLY